MSRHRARIEPSLPIGGEMPSWLPPAALALAVAIVYSVSIDAPLIFDDLLSIEQNPSIVRLWPLWGDAQHPGPLRPPAELPVSARPLVNLTFALNHHFSGIAPRGYRVVNIAIHILSTILLWSIVRQTLRLPRFDRRYDQVAGRLALVVALVWAVHPLLTEAVVYVTQRTELMVSLFYLTVLAASMRYWTAASPSNRRIWLCVAGLAAVAGAASKEVFVTAPIVVLLFEWTFVRSSVAEIARRSWPLYLAIGQSWLMLAWLQLGSPRSESAGFGLGLPVVDWWSTQANVFLMYLKLAAYPWPLSVHYQYPIQPLQVHWPSVLATALLILATIVLLWRRSPAGFLLAAAMLVLAPSHLVPIPTEMAAERRMYLPLAALVALGVVGTYTLIVRVTAGGNTRSANRNSLRVLSSIAAAALLIIYVLISIGRVALYREPAMLWQDAAEHQPQSPVIQLNLAIALSEAGRLEESLPPYRAAIRLEPANSRAHYGLALALAHLGRVDDSLAEMRHVLELSPDAYRIRNNLGVMLFTAGRYQEAAAEFEKVLQLEPDFAEARENLNRARQASVLPQKAE